MDKQYFDQLIKGVRQKASHGRQSRPRPAQDGVGRGSRKSKKGLASPRGVGHCRTGKVSAPPIALKLGLIRYGDRPSQARRSTLFRQRSPISTPMLLRPQWAQARLVVPVPMKGSSTVSPTKLNMRTTRSAGSSG